MTNNDRFYQLEFKNRPVLHGDIGSMLRIEGLVVGGGGAAAMMLLPSTTLKTAEQLQIIEMNTEAWSEWLQRSDVPEILVSGAGLAKAFHRKVRYEISGHIQQRVWVADDFKCVYCNRKMGEVQLTIDHFIPLELGGSNSPANYLSACRRCNKDKGSQDPKAWCKPQQYLELVHYLEHRTI